MADGEGEARTGLYWGVAAVLVAAVGVAFWATRDMPDLPPAEALEKPAPAPDTRPPAGTRAAAGPAAEAPPVVRAPAVRIADQGRLQTTEEALREGDVLALGLELPDEARGEGARPVRIVDVTGRVLDLQAQPVAGPGTGLRLEIDPTWLRPGRYMIVVETDEKRPLATRRYVLEVGAEGSASN